MHDRPLDHDTPRLNSRLPERPTPADVTLAYLCACAALHRPLGDLQHQPCRFCAFVPAELAAWADAYGRPHDPLPARPVQRMAAR